MIFYLLMPLLLLRRPRPSSLMSKIPLSSLIGALVEYTRCFPRVFLGCQPSLVALRDFCFLCFVHAPRGCHFRGCCFAFHSPAASHRQHFRRGPGALPRCTKGKSRGAFLPLNSSLGEEENSSDAESQRPGHPVPPLVPDDSGTL